MCAKYFHGIGCFDPGAVLFYSLDTLQAAFSQYGTLTGTAHADAALISA